MRGRKPTAEEVRHMCDVRALGCLACKNQMIYTPPEYTLIHHVYGKTKPDAHLKVLPLCDRHHSPHYTTGLHANKTEWQLEHGTEEKLLEQVRELLDA